LLSASSLRICGTRLIPVGNPVLMIKSLKGKGLIKTKDNPPSPRLRWTKKGKR